MTPSSILIILCSIALTSLFAVSFINQRETKTRMVRNKVRSLKARLEEMEALVAKLDQVLESRAITKLINDEIIDLAKGMINLDADATYLQASLANAEQRALDLIDEGAPRDISRLFESDAQIARYQHALNEAGIILRRLYARDSIDLAELEIFISELSWCHLMIETVSVIGQGHKAINRSEIITAHAFYKRARQSLIQSSHNDPRRHRFIKEIGEVLNNKRKLLSEDLMHEQV